MIADYATPSAFYSNREQALLGLSVDRQRPVRFHGRVRNDAAFLLRVLLRAMGEVIWASDSYESSDFILDPIITVHDDAIFLEAFSQDKSCYVRADLSRELFEPDGEVIAGTTNIDFSAWLWAALAELRSHRETWLRVGPEGFEVRTTGSGGRFERKVDVPDDWLRAVLQLQEAMVMPGVRFSARPVDILAAIRYLTFNKARVSPQGIRYEFAPGEAVKLLLEPWEKEIVLKGSEHIYTEPKTIRLWGRRRLRHLEKVLPFADSVDVYLTGRARPSFYHVQWPGMSLLLGLSGWSDQSWSGLAGLARRQSEAGDAAWLQRAYELLQNRQCMRGQELGQQLGVDPVQAQRLLQRLIRQGRAVYDLRLKAYRQRELFAELPDEQRLFPPDRKLELAERLLDEQKVAVSACQAEETRKQRHLKTPEGRKSYELIYRDWNVQGTADGFEVRIVVNEAGNIIFGQCGCDYFRRNLLNQGPCEHMLALYRASENSRQDIAVSRPGVELPKFSAEYGDDEDSDGL